MHCHRNSTVTVISHVLLAGSRDFLPEGSDRLQQCALAGVSISKNGHNHHRQNFGVRVQRIELFIRADLVEYAFANSQIERAKTGAIKALALHRANLSGPPPVLLRRAFITEASAITSPVTWQGVLGGL